MVPEPIASCLTRTENGVWMVWAHKVARPVGDRFQPVTGGTPYPIDAVATCALGMAHRAPDVYCTCGFHALSTPAPGLYDTRFKPLEVALTGRVLAFDFRRGGVLFRAERQTVMRHAYSAFPVRPLPPEPPLEPGGRTARLLPTHPRDIDRVGLRLPTSPPELLRLTDDAGLCELDLSEPAMTQDRTQSHREYRPVCL
ncbi:hypothetical protein AB0N05_38305 [Nocardia sp. NPDC051030]|uniref:hypothetical protein n=1 Tax=Nocardia sp. NPDC051030 TaxID=3155162 RepID=UPI0034142EEC